MPSDLAGALDALLPVQPLEELPDPQAHQVAFLSALDAGGKMARVRQPLVQKPFDLRALADLLDRTAPAEA